MIPLKAAVLTRWESVHASYWFVPSLMALASVLLSFVMVWLDQRYGGAWPEGVRWFYTGTAEGARTLLSMIASSMITVAGTVFSIHIVALSLASQQYGPRLLRNFMRDLGSQIVLGAFTANYLYCMLVLRTIHGGQEQGDRFVPQLSILVAVLMAVAALGLLIYFIHHTAASVRVANIIAEIANDLHETIEEYHARKPGERASDASPAAAPSPPQGPYARIRAETGGYIERIEYDDLLELAIEHDLVIQIERRAGQYVQADEPVLRIWPAGKVDDRLHRLLALTFTIGDERTLQQDPEYAVDQLVEIAIRALSPGINDPFTAIACIDRLGEGLSHLASHPIARGDRYDEQGKLRIIAFSTDFRSFIDTSFSELRQYGDSSLPVQLRLLDALTRIARCAVTDEARQAIQEHADAVYRCALEATQTAMDREAVEHRKQTLTQCLHERGSAQ